MYAVLETGGKQYRVAAGDTLEIERLEVEAGKAFTFDRVLLVSNDGKHSVGVPIAFKMRRRKGYHRTVGHRQELTVVKIKEIKF